MGPVRPKTGILESMSQFDNKTSELSDKVEKIKKDAEKEINNVLISANTQASESKERLMLIEADFNDKQKELSSKLEIIKDELAIQLSELKWRNNLAMLADKSIASGDRVAYNELEKLAKEFYGTDKGKIVVSYIVQVKNFYLNTRRFKDVNVVSDGEIFNIEDKPTHLLLNQLKTNKDPIVRYKIAEFMTKRREKGVPDVLIECMKNDKNLNVVAQIGRTLGTIMDYDVPDIFGVDYLSKYWNENKEEINKKLSNPKTEIKWDDFLEYHPDIQSLPSWKMINKENK